MRRKTHCLRTFCSPFRIPDTKGPAPCTRQLIDIYRKYNASAISLEEVPQEKVERYGIISRSEVENSICKISRLVEKPPKDRAPSNPAIWQDLFSHRTSSTGSMKPKPDTAVKSSCPMPCRNWIQYTESDLKAKHMI